MTTPSDLIAKARELDAKASNGPWLRDPSTNPSMQVVACGNEVIIYHHEHGRQINQRVVSNMEFCAASRTLIPQLADALERALETIRNAPHGPGCGSLSWYEMSEAEPPKPHCTCWKSNHPTQ